MVDQVVEIRTEASVIDRRGAGEDGEHGIAIDDWTRDSRTQFTNWNAVADHCETLAPVECAHEIATLVPEITLRYRSPSQLAGKSSGRGRSASARPGMFSGRMRQVSAASPETKSMTNRAVSR